MCPVRPKFLADGHMDGQRTNWQTDRHKWRN